MTFINSIALVSENIEKLFHVPNLVYENRYCVQDDFSILVYWGKSVYSRDPMDLNDDYELKMPNFKYGKFSNMLEGR